MTEETTGSDGWFADLDPDDGERAAAAIREGTAERPRAWPAEAVEAGFAADEREYYDRLRDVIIRGTEAEVAERERADDRQLLHAVRAMDDCERTANELAERVAEWAGTRFADAGTGVAYARELAERGPSDPAERKPADPAERKPADPAERKPADPAERKPADPAERKPADPAERKTSDPAERRLVALARRTAALADEAEALRRHVETTAPDVAPNLAALAGPVLAARLISLAGGLESLAKKPSGTIQVLGAEDALFAHLRGSAPSPKHGVIYTHDYVRGTDPAERGSAARALAGKLAIAARIDHYSGDRRPALEAELDDRIATIRSRGEG